jgi:CxxC motif-containing protein (DUF1111 family)
MFLLAIATISRADEPDFGEPLRGLSTQERARFFEGLEAFNEEERPETGLGPVFNAVSCGVCHAAPALGGGGEVVTMRIGRRIGGRFDPLIQFGGPTIQTKGIGDGIGINGPFHFVGERAPAQATIRAGRRTTALFGLGLVEGIPDQALVDLSIKQMRTSPTTAGRPHVVTTRSTRTQAVGRFGWKAQHATLLDFGGEAYLTELGVTTPLFPVETPPQGNSRSLARNPVSNNTPNRPDNADLEKFADFMRLLAPPPHFNNGEDTSQGRSVFYAIGCADCHVERQATGPHQTASLDRIAFYPYSDFLLHDMGPLGDGIQHGDAGPREMRTPPLWGLWTRESLLHDGRATTVEQAIMAHAGQGLRAKRRYAALSAAKKKALLAFLGSL